MIELKFGVGFITGTLGTVITFILGDWTQGLTALFLFMAFDIVTGVFKGGIEGTLSSSKMYRGLFKKFGTLVIVGMANTIDNMIGGDPVIRTLCIYAYIGMEGLSVIENLGKMGVPIPEKVKSMLEQFSEKAKEK